MYKVRFFEKTVIYEKDNASLARDKTLRESVLFGVAAGAAAVMTPGTELCRREDTERLYQEMISEAD